MSGGTAAQKSTPERAGIGEIPNGWLHIIAAIPNRLSARKPNGAGTTFGEHA
jgi:hypothetical protein